MATDHSARGASRRTAGLPMAGRPFSRRGDVAVEDLATSTDSAAIARLSREIAIAPARAMAPHRHAPQSPLEEKSPRRGPVLPYRPVSGGAGTALAQERQRERAPTAGRIGARS